MRLYYTGKPGLPAGRFVIRKNKTLLKNFVFCDLIEKDTTILLARICYCMLYYFIPYEYFRAICFELILIVLQAILISSLCGS